jgi:hypothetical protein
MKAAAFLSEASISYIMTCRSEGKSSPRAATAVHIRSREAVVDAVGVAIPAAVQEEEEEEEEEVASLSPLLPSSPGAWYARKASSASS